MKLRKNEIKVSKNFLIPPWTMAVSYGEKESFQARNDFGKLG